jgi:hypothetical protein
MTRARDVQASSYLFVLLALVCREGPSKDMIAGFTEKNRATTVQALER